MSRVKVEVTKSDPYMPFEKLSKGETFWFAGKHYMKVTGDGAFDFVEYCLRSFVPEVEVLPTKARLVIDNVRM
jgi:hypothetical protein